MVLRSARPWLAGLSLALASGCALAQPPERGACLASLQPGAASPLAVVTARGSFEVTAAADAAGTAQDMRLHARRLPASADKAPQPVLQGVRSTLYSGLLTRGLAPIALSEIRVDGMELTGILRADRTPALLGLVVTQAVPDDGRTVTAYWFPPDLSPDTAPATVAALEYMYAHVLRLPPEYRHAWATPGRPQPAEPPVPQTQGEVLARIAAWRNCAVRSLPAAQGAAVPRPWQTVDLQPRTSAAVPGADGHVVTVAVDRSAEELRGASITFTRQPHLVCQVDIGVDGVASCKLVDAHFHEHQHDNEGDTTTATFSGAIGSAAVLLPTTATWRHVPRAFAKPFNQGLAEAQRP